MNTNTLVFAIQSGGSLVFFALLARWYLWPRQAKLSQAEALTPLLLFQATRFLGLSVIVPTIVAPDLPGRFAEPAAYGDLVAAGLALASIVALRTRLPIATPAVWVFSVWGIADLANALVQGLAIGLPSYQLGVVWVIYTVLVPAFWVTHVVIVARLVRPSAATDDARLDAWPTRVSRPS